MSQTTAEATSPYSVNIGALRLTQQVIGETDVRATAGIDIVYYLMLPDDLIKIGTTRRPLTRLREHRYRTGPVTVMAIEFGGRDLEAQRHAQFAHLRVGRLEQFIADDALMDHIESLREIAGLSV